MGVKANVCFGQVKRRSVGSGESGFWGVGIGGGGGGGLKIKVWETKVVKDVKRRNSLGAAVAVLTSDVSEETMVSDFLFLESSSCSRWFHFLSLPLLIDSVITPGFACTHVWLPDGRAQERCIHNTGWRGRHSALPSH